MAKASRSLEHEGLLHTRVDGGIRVHPATTKPSAVIHHARAFAAASTNVPIDDAIRILRAVWPHPDPSAPQEEPHRG